MTAMATCEMEEVDIKEQIIRREMKITKQEAYDRCLKATGDQLATKVLVDKYFLCDHDGNYHETEPSQMWDRLANKIIEVEEPCKREIYRKLFREVLDDFKFVPAGRILYGLGNSFVNVTLKNCYVIGIRDDSIKGIFQTAYEMAETYKSGGGCGVDISPLRPRNSPVHNAARYSSGSVSFMDFFSHITGMIGQNARIGALMLCIDVSHPDVEEFISIKSGDDLNKVRYANISVKITDDFMHAVQNDSNYDLRWGGKVYKTIKARELWSKIIHYAWKRAEPGILFWDTVCREVPAHNYPGFKCIATNPCAEACISDGDSCNLGSINLSKYVKNPFENPNFDFKSFEKDVKLGVRFLDNIIDLEKCPMEFQQRANNNGRRLGLGIMGVADMFLKMRIKYDSDEAIELADHVMNSFMVSSYNASCDLAKEKGSFPVFDANTHFKSSYVQKLPEDIKNRIRTDGIRNIAVHAIAPTGSLSCIAQCSSSIEPVFMIKHIRKTNLGTSKKVQEHLIYHPVAKKFAEKFGEPFPAFFVEAHDINPMHRIKLQSTFQRYVDQAVSHTVNIPKNAKEEQVAYYYMEAWKQKCKGITIYRDGSREGILVSIDKKKDEIQVHAAPKRPKELDADVHVIKPNGRTYTIFVGLLGDRVYEVFALDHTLAGINDGIKGKITREINDNVRIYSFESGLMAIKQINRYEDTDASLITRLISTSLRHGTPLEFIIDQITKSKIPVTAFAKAIARALSKYIKQEEVEGKFRCPKCNSRNVHFEGVCRCCRDCGDSSCQ